MLCLPRMHIRQPYFQKATPLSKQCFLEQTMFNSNFTSYKPEPPSLCLNSIISHANKITRSNYYNAKYLTLAPTPSQYSDRKLYYEI